MIDNLIISVHMIILKIEILLSFHSFLNLNYLKLATERGPGRKLYLAARAHRYVV